MTSGPSSSAAAPEPSSGRSALPLVGVIGRSALLVVALGFRVAGAVASRSLEGVADRFERLARSADPGRD